VELPADFSNPLLAGKTVEFQVKIHEVKEKEVPELDDAFAQSLGGNFKTLADLHAAVREDIIKVKERERQGLLENQALDQLLARHPFEVPPSLVRQEQESIFRDQAERMRQHGIDLAGMNPEKMLETYKPLAERRVRVGLLLERIAAQEKVDVDEAEVDGHLERVAAQSGKPVEQIRQFYQERDFLGAVRRQLRDEKTLKLILEKATIGVAAEAQEQT
jgi:trigger factor